MEILEHGWEAWSLFSGPGMVKTGEPESPASKASASGPSDCCVLSHWLPRHLLPCPLPPLVSIEFPFCSKGATSPEVRTSPLSPLRTSRTQGIAYSKREATSGPIPGPWAIREQGDPFGIVTWLSCSPNQNCKPAVQPWSENVEPTFKN